jgi:hypothetical protein
MLTFSLAGGKMVNEFMRRRRSGKFFHSVSVVDRINSAALSFVEEANQEYKGARVITKGMTLEVVRRSLADNAGETFSVKRHRALADVSQFVALAHKNKIVASVSKNHDLLPISHPESARAHSFSADSLDRARALWVADDPIIKDEETRSFVVTALCASIDSPEAQYAVARLKSLPPGEIPPVVLFAISEDEPLEPLLAFSIPGINVSRRIRKGIFRMGNSRAARSARARAQRRDRRGRFAWMGAGLLFLLEGRRGSVSRKRGRVVGQSPTSNTFDVEFPDGQLVRVPADKAEAVKAVLGEDLTKGKGSAPVSISAADKVVSPAEMESIEAPSGFSKDTSWSPDEDSVSYYGRNTDNGTLYTDDAYDVLQFKTGNAQAKDRFEIAQQKQAEGQDIVVLGAGKDGAIDDTKPVYFIQRRDGKGGIFGVTQSWADVQRFISQDQKLFEKDKPVDPSGLEKWEADNPEGESIADLPDADGPEDTEAPEATPDTAEEAPEESDAAAPEWTDRFGRSIPIGRPVNFKVNHPKKGDVDVYGEFAGDSGKDGVGLVRVEGDPNLPDGLYEVSSENGAEYLPSYKPEYLESVGIKQGFNEAGEAVPARTAAQIPAVDEIVRRDLEDVDESKRPEFDGWEKTSFSKEIDEYVESRRDSILAYEREKTQLWNESQEPGYERGSAFDYPPESEPLGTPEERTEAALNDLRQDLLKFYEEDNYVYSKGDNQIIVNKRLAQRDPEYVEEIVETASVLVENEPVTGGVSTYIQPRLSARVNFDGVINTFAGGTALRGRSGIFGRPTTINMHYRNALNFRGLDNPLDVLGERVYVPFGYEGADGEGSRKNARGTFAHEWGHARDFNFGEGGGLYTKEMKGLVESDPSTLDGLGWYGRTNISESVAEYYSQYVGEKYFGAEPMGMPQAVIDLFEADNPPLPEGDSFNMSGFKENTKYTLPENDTYNSDGSRKEGVEDKFARPAGGGDAPPFKLAEPRALEPGESPLSEDFIDFGPEPAFAEVKDFLDKPLKSLTDEELSLVARFKKNYTVSLDEKSEFEFVMDEVRRRRGEDTPAEPEEVKPAPDGMYTVDRGQFVPQGAQDGVESGDYTDDPVELAQRFSSEELREALAEAVTNGSGEALLPFDEGDEYVPAEALFNALKEQGEDADQILDDIYEGTEGDESPEELPESEGQEGEASGPLTVEEISENREEINEMLPELLRGLTDEEVAQVFEDEDYSQYLPENEEFDVPEGMYELDSNPFPVNQDFAPEDAPEGSPTSPIDLASDMSSEDLEDMLRRAITGETDRLGYAGVVMPDDDGEDFEYDVPAEAIRDALQLQGLDTNEILRETYDNNEPTPEEAEDMLEGEDVEEIDDDGEPGESAGDGDAGGPGGSGEDVSEPEADGPGDSDGESPWSSLDNPVTEAARAEVLRERGYPTPEIFELDSEQDAEAFVQMMEGLKEGNPYASSVYIYDVEEYREMRLFSTADGRAGFGIKPNGDIVSVYIYSDSDHRKGTLSMLAQAVELGGDRLDAYDTVLPKIYAQAGFKPVSRVRWNTDFEPDGWDPELYAEFNNGQPDVVAMAYDPDRVDSEYDSSEGEYFDDYDAAMAARDASIDGEPAETAEAAEPVEASDFNQIYDTSGWTQVGGQGGSNEGGFFEDPQGNEYYVKIPKSEDHARNEVAASALYEAADLDVGRVYFGRNGDGDLVLVSPIISAVDGELGEFINDEGVPESAWGGFAVDAWLNNWDAVGLTYDNMLVKDGKVFRIDPGGSLFYRAQGAEKGLPDDVTLIESLRNPDVNQQSARVFGGMTDEDVRGSVRKLEALTPERISEVVDEIYADDPDRGNEVKEKLLARREWLIENYGSADAAQPEETVEPEEPGSVDRLILDFDSDIEEQISTAVSEGRRLVFSYDGVDRDVTPIGELEFNEKTGNTNVLTVDSEGNYKKFTLSKMKPAENASALDEADTPGEDIPVNDAGIPEKQLKESAKQVDALVDTIFNTDDITSTDIENYGEGDGVDDDLTDSVIEAVDGLPEAPDADAPATLEEQVLADAIESAFEGDVDDVPSSVDELIQASEAIDGGFVKPDIIWQEILDTYNGKKLDNGHIVVSSTMHGDRRYDVLVRRANNNTFHIYHRITSPDGSTKVREMGKKGWHSTKALFGKIDAQIDNSRNSPKTTVDKHLTSENIKTLYSDSSTPKQPDSYVDANGNTIKPGDRIVVVNETHSKFGVGARVVSKTELFAGGDSKESEKYLYTDYVRVQYDDDGSYNWIVSQSTALEGTEGTSAGPTEAPATSSVPSNPESSLSAFSSGQTLTYAQAETLPKGAVVSLEDGTLIRKGASGIWIIHLDGMGMPAFFAEGMEAKFQSYDPYFKKTPPKKIDPLKDGPPQPPSSSKTEAEKAAEPELPQGKPLSGMKYAKSPSAPKFYDEDSANVGVMQSNLNTLGSGKAFANEYEGSGNRAQMEEFFQAAFADAPENQLPSIPRDKNGQMLVPGSVVNVGEGFDTFAIVTEIQDYYYPDDSSSSGTGTVDIVIINGAEKGSEYVSVDASELTGNSTFINTQQAKDTFNVEIDDKFRNTLREGKQALYSPTVYKNQDMVTGPGFEEPELESLPSWGNSVEGVKTVEDIMKDLRNFGVTGSDAGDGYYTLIDSSAIEDGQVRFQRVVNENNEIEIRITGKLTHWAGNDTQKKLSEDGKGPESGNGSAGIKLEGFTYDADGSLVSRGDTAQYLVDSQERGTTYIGEYGRAKINFFRAMPESTDNSLSDGEKKVDFFADPRYTSNPVTFHNMFDIRLPENASQGDIERALQELGVASARPATDIDVKNIAENKLLWLFGSLTDGTRNPSSVLRQQELQKIKQEWGVTADDIVVETDGTTQQRPVFLMPQAIADKIAQRTGVDVMHHNLHITASNKQDVVDTVVKIIMSGRLESTLGRHISGDFGSGKSSSEDVNGPGANYSFFYMNKDFSQDAGGMTGQVNFVFDARTLLRRFDFYANTADGWGGLYGADVDVIGNMSNRQSNAEILFKHNVSLENLMGVAMTDEVREAVLEELRAMGIDYLGDASIENIFDHDVDQYL